jgi:hypothetical protein
MATTGKQEKVDFVISCLKNGEARGKILTKTVGKWQMSTRTFDRLLKVASAQHTKTSQKLKEELDKVEHDAAIDSRKKAIIGIYERQEILSKIAKGELKVKRRVPGYEDRMRAITELNKMDGNYAPAKFANTTSAGEDIPQPSSIVITPAPISQQFEIKESE